MRHFLLPTIVDRPVISRGGIAFSSLRASSTQLPLTDCPECLLPLSSMLPLLAIVFLAATTTNDAATLNITNGCSFTVWPAATPVGGGTRLDPGKTWSVDVPAGTAGRAWARTGCSFHAGNGSGSCQTGDCGGQLACKTSGRSPATLAEFSISGFNETDFFDISIIDGFNLPMNFLPLPAPAPPPRGQACTKGPICAANITAECPAKLTKPGGCINTCNATAPNSCDEPSLYSLLFARMCPGAYIIPNDITSMTLFSCPSGTDYQIIFCPPSNLTTLRAPTPQPAPVGPTSRGRRRSSRPVVLVLVLALVGAFILLLLVAAIFFVYKRRTRHREPEEEEEFGELQGLPIRFTFHQLHVATEQFRDKLGEGGFGSVFKGQLGDEQIAVKRLDRAGQGKREFLAEIQTIGSIHHINLVRLIGFCAEKSHRLLVYEYMPNGSLDRWLYYRHVSNTTPLDWQTRHKIITHVAKGLSYLHEECTKRIAHLDVKPQNILLDDNFDAKLSDFGLCKLIDRDKSQVVTRMRGTPGYLAPEWLTSQITEKADIYSFGIVVMEIISGRKNLDNSRSEESIHLITLLEEKAKSDQLVDLIDKHCNNMVIHKQEVIQMMKLAMWCLQIDCKRRPQMSEVIKVLEGTMNVETNIDHSFVATSPVNFGIAGNVGFSPPALASHLSGPSLRDHTDPMSDSCRDIRQSPLQVCNNAEFPTTQLVQLWRRISYRRSS